MGVKQTEAGEGGGGWGWRPCPCLVVVAWTPLAWCETAHCYDALGLAFSSGLGMAMEIGGGMEDGHGAVTGKELSKGD